MSNSSKAEVVPVSLIKHPNADSLSIVEVFGGYTCCVKTQDWLGIDKAVYIPPDSVVDASRSEFSFLVTQAKADGKAKIKAKRLRGVVSFGLLIPAPPKASIGDDLTDFLGITHYNPDSEFAKSDKGFNYGGDAASPPNLPYLPGKYDIENVRRYPRLIESGESVVINEKLDGEHSSYVYWDGNYHCKSRTMWKKEFPDYSHITVEHLVSCGQTEEKAKEVIDNLNQKGKPQSKWWRVLRQTEPLMKFLRDNPGVIVFGENFGHVQKLRYGHGPNEISFAAFDVMKDGRWLDYREARDMCSDVPWAPELAIDMPYDFEGVCKLAEGRSMWPGASNIREGCVVKPMVGRHTHEIGRLILKCISGEYLEKFR